MKKCIQILTKIWNALCCPESWFEHLKKNDRKGKTICFAICFFITGYMLQKKWYFPCFWEFTFVFFAIGLMALLCIHYFSGQMNEITARLVKQPAALSANAIYYKYCVNSFLYILIPLMVVVIFEAGGCSMFGAMQINPTLFWVLILFSIVVYVSIIGYLQYVALALFIFKLSHGNKSYQGLQKTGIHCVPAQLEWLQSLTKLYHVYRASFFTLGGLFMIAFGAFCRIPQMEAKTDSPMFFILWGIISVAIVLVFPITAILEYEWIKSIVSQLKNAYIAELEREVCSCEGNSNRQKDSTEQQKFIQIICATQILNSKNYPVDSAWNTVYAVSISAFNLATSMITILQGGPMLLIYLHRIF